MQHQPGSDRRLLLQSPKHVLLFCAFMHNLGQIECKDLTGLNIYELESFRFRISTCLLAKLMDGHLGLGGFLQTLQLLSLQSFWTWWCSSCCSRFIWTMTNHDSYSEASSIKIRMAVFIRHLHSWSSAASSSALLHRWSTSLRPSSASEEEEDELVEEDDELEEEEDELEDDDDKMESSSSYGSFKSSMEIRKKWSSLTSISESKPLMKLFVLAWSTVYRWKTCFSFH